MTNLTVAELGVTRARFAAMLSRHLVRGEQLAVYGPRGVGKTTLVCALGRNLGRRRVPCAIAVHTGALSDITEALRAIYSVGGVDLPQRRLRSRLQSATERQRGVLLLDHVSNVTLAMRSFVRSLRGGLVGVGFFVDADTKAEHERMRSWHLGHQEYEIPSMSFSALRQLLSDESWSDVPEIQEHVVRAAKGRPGFIVHCIELAARDDYWKQRRLLVNTLCSHAEVATRGLPDGIKSLARSIE